MSDKPNNEGNTNVPNLKEALVLGAAAIQKCLRTESILDGDNTPLGRADKDYLWSISAAMTIMGTESNDLMAVVLNDGETFSGIHGCKVVLWNGDVDQLEELLADGEEQTLFKF
jgi:hypothetical protein